MKNIFRNILILSFLLTVISAKNVTVIGIGRLGLSFALCLERAGYNVLGVDVSESYISSINLDFVQFSDRFLQFFGLPVKGMFPKNAILSAPKFY